MKPFFILRVSSLHFYLICFLIRIMITIVTRYCLTKHLMNKTYTRSIFLCSRFRRWFYFLLHTVVNSFSIPRAVFNSKSVTIYFKTDSYFYKQCFQQYEGHHQTQFRFYLISQRALWLVVKRQANVHNYGSVYTAP